MSAIYLFIGGAYADCRWVSAIPPNEDQWDSWHSGELEIFRFENGEVYEPRGVDDFKRIEAKDFTTVSGQEK